MQNSLCKLLLFNKIYSNFFFSTLFLILFLFVALNTCMFSTNFKKIGCIFAENIFYEKSKMAEML